MEKQKVIIYQTDLPFGERGNIMSHSENCADVNQANAGKEQQIVLASKQERALTENLMTVICSKENLRRAFKQVKKNKGSAGIDAVSIEEFKEWYPNNESQLIDSLLKGTYQPLPVKGVEIDKPDGGKRQLGIPTVQDRFIQQAIYQVLNQIFDSTFSENSYGFREGRSAHQALSQARIYVADGHTIVVDIDLEKFFDKVNHDRLMYNLSEKIQDKILLKLIRKYLQSGILLGGLVSQRTEGTPQGSPLSPLLSNIVLDELDKELEKRGHKFCRYADDCNIYVKTQIAGERVMQSITNYIENHLKLKVNPKKSKVAVCHECKFLGYRLLKGGILGVSPKNIKRLKDKIREITHRNRGVNLATIIQELNNSLRGWLNYFHHAKMSELVKDLDQWIRRKLRCFRLKQCKKPFAIKEFLRKLGVSTWQAWLIALSGKGWWRLSNTPQVHQAMNLEWFNKQGLFNLTLNYERLNR